MIVLVPQRSARDCGVACFATLLQVSYEEAYHALAEVSSPEKLRRGVYLRDMTAAALRLNRTIVSKRRYRLDEVPLGVIHLNRKRDAHVAVAIDGKLYDPQENALWDQDDYLRHYGYRPTILMVAA